MGSRDSLRIAGLDTRRIWDSRGLPAVEVEVRCEGGAAGRGSHPAAGLTAPGEVAPLVDGGPAFGGQDVSAALGFGRTVLAGALVGRDAGDQAGIDRQLAELPGPGGHGTAPAAVAFAASLAVAQAAAGGRGLALWQHLAAGAEPEVLPMPRILLLDLGRAPGPGQDATAVWLVPAGAGDLAIALDWCAQTTRAAAELVERHGRGPLSAGPRGGLRSAVSDAETALWLATRAIERAGLVPGEDIALVLEVRAWQFGRGGRYVVGRDGGQIDTRAMIDRYLGWLGRYPLHGLADPLAIDEIAGGRALSEAAGSGVEIALGDAVLSDARRLEPFIEAGVANALVLKAVQAPTLTALKRAKDAASAVGWATILAARTGEVEPAWLAHAAVGWGVGQLAAGGLARGERLLPWNEALRIGEALGAGLRLAPSRGSQ